MLNEEPPTMIIEAPKYYEKTHMLTECPLCHNPDPYLDMHMRVREFGYFDINLYACSTVCSCSPVCDKVHKFSAKHELLRDVRNLKIYDRTHFKNVWVTIVKESYGKPRTYLSPVF
jgi:hypothetical protein